MDKLKKWAYNELVSRVEKIKDNGLRLGQNYFNELNNFDPRMAKKIKGTEFDPFYDDFKIEKFLDHIKNKFYVVNSQFNGYKIFNFEQDTLFYTSDREQVKRVVEKLRETGEIIEEPITDFKPKLLLIRERDWNYHYLIREESDLNECAWTYFKDNISCSKSYNFEEWKVTKPLDYDQKFVDSAPESMKKKLQSKLDSNIKEIKSDNQHNNLVRFLKKKIDKEIKSGCYALLREFNIEYELEDFLNIK